ncbi:hypothetical protein LUZ60_012550 [Juncus effusus]|nr:hypothetical protein LUZ60_012550 [Juncus effusus]
MIKMVTSKSLTTISLLLAILGLLAPSYKADNVLFSGETMYSGQSLTWGSYTLTMQNDCNLVLYDSGRAVWSSQTYNRGSGCFLRMQVDGNLVVYDSSNRALWASNTGRGQGNYVLVLQKDRNIVIYGPAIWGAGTNRVGTADVVIGNNTTEPAVKISENIAMVVGN